MIGSPLGVRHRESPLSQALETVARMAHEVERGLPIAPGTLRMDDDGILTVNRESVSSRHHFFLDGLMFHASLTPREDHTVFQIWAEIGYMPYSIESPQKRARLMTVLRATGWLERAKFIVDEKQKILVLGQVEVEGTMTLADLMYETIQFLQEARPYLRVFGECL